jgi:2-oxoglutarate dehydrogenase E1 component
MEQSVEGSHIFSGNSEFIEQLYEEYLRDPRGVPPPWREYFDSLQDEQFPSRDASEAQIRKVAKRPGRWAAGATPQSLAARALEMARKQSAVLRLIQAYRLLGHLRAHVDSINLRAMPVVPDLDPAFHGLTESDLDVVFNAGALPGKPERTLREIIELLQETYTEHIGVEFMHIYDLEQKTWLQTHLESTRTNPDYPADVRTRLLDRITAAEGIEQYLHTKYTGQKRFSLEGGETLITALDEIVQRSGTQGIREIVIGMAHRGRLNVLVNIMGKSPKDLFSEFEGKKENKWGRTGDVKYHQGYSSDVETPGGIVHLALGFNPSHLEISDPVTVGSVRSRQERRHDHERTRVMAVLIHGDAAFAGQGVVYETLNLSQTRGYSTGGTIHIVVNNRIGFTTSHPLDVRSTLYCTDVGKVIQAPIFHVNGDDPDAVAFVAQLAVNYRMAFRRDVIVDIICYRRHGHNEADEPLATQPMMYKKIRQSPTVRQVYAARLIEEGVVGAGEPDAMAQRYRDALEAGSQVAPNIVVGLPNPHRTDWARFRQARWTDGPDTAVSIAELRRLGQALCVLPENFELHPRVAKVVDDRLKMAAGALPVDWGFAEIMAYATLLLDGHPVRLSGQDSGRGTFFHRHAVLHDQNSGDEYVPLQHVSGQQPPFTIIDSILSEEAVLGFEYGYSAADPNSLVIWEAQFGDFANGAQVVIDQFIVAAEQKWGLLTGLVLLLPHGWEGQGPEHTSARLERFLQLCAQDNIQVCYPTTPAQMFHMLRRQMRRPFRKPLVVMTPKSTLRRKISFSALDDLARGGFRPVIGEVDPVKDGDVKRVVLCSGKVFFDLLETRRERGISDIALIRLEQLYPFPGDLLSAELKRYRNAPEVIWAQEEPQNQGAWYSIQHAIRSCMKSEQVLNYVGRAPMSAPSGGDHAKSAERQKLLVDQALTLPQKPVASPATLQPQLVAAPAASRE